jgi:RNA binding exosome subunit
LQISARRYYSNRIEFASSNIDRASEARRLSRRFRQLAETTHHQGMQAGGGRTCIWTSVHERVQGRRRPCPRVRPIAAYLGIIDSNKMMNFIDPDSIETFPYSFHFSLSDFTIFRNFS